MLNSSSEPRHPSSLRGNDGNSEAKESSSNKQNIDIMKRSKPNASDQHSERVSLPSSNEELKKESAAPQSSEVKEDRSAFKITRNLPPEELFKIIRSGLDELEKASEYNATHHLQIVKSLSGAYTQYTKLRQEIGDRLKDWMFADLAIKMLKYFNKVGLFSSDPMWFVAYYTLHSCWNYTDASSKLTTDFLEKGMVNLMAENIGHKPYLDNLETKNVAYVIKASLSILQNISKVQGSASYYEQANVKARLKPFLESENDFYKATATMTLTAVITEEENAMLEDTGAISFMVSGVKKALTGKNRRYRGLTTTELTECLGRMAVNDKDNIKVKVVNEGALPAFVKMMQHTEESEQYAAARTIWTLSFDSEVKQKLKEEPNCLETLEKLAASGNDHVVRMAKGALWSIQGDNKSESQQSTKNYY